MTTLPGELGIDEYLHRRLMPVDEAIPQLTGIDIYGSSAPAGQVGGDLFEYINFQQRYDIETRIARALKQSSEYLSPLPEGPLPRNIIDIHAEWMQARSDFHMEDAAQYRRAKSSEQLRIADNLQKLPTTAGVLLVDAQGYDII